MNIKPDPNNWHIEVYPRRAGQFSGCSISGMKYSDSEADRLQKDIMEQIRWHVDDINSSNVIYDGYVCQCGNEYETKEEAENCCLNN